MVAWASKTPRSSSLSLHNLCLAKCRISYNAYLGHWPTYRKQGQAHFENHLHTIWTTTHLGTLDVRSLGAAAVSLDACDVCSPGNLPGTCHASHFLSTQTESPSTRHLCVYFDGTARLAYFRHCPIPLAKSELGTKRNHGPDL